MANEITQKPVNNIFFSETRPLNQWNVLLNGAVKFKGTEEQMSRAMMINTWDAKSLRGLYNENQLSLYRDMYDLTLINSEKKSLTLCQV